AVHAEPGGHSLRPVARAPDALALRVVDRALEHGCPGHGRRDRGTADVVRVEVRDGDPVDVQVLPGCAAEAEARIEERAVDDITVDVPRAGRQRQGQPGNTVFQRYERLFYDPCTGQCVSSIAKSPAGAHSTR